MKKDMVLKVEEFWYIFFLKFMISDSVNLHSVSFQPK